MHINRTELAYLEQARTQTTDHSAQEGRTEGEGRVSIVPEIDKKLGDVSPSSDNWFPFDILRFFICVLKARRFIKGRSLLLITWNVVG